MTRARNLRQQRSKADIEAAAVQYATLSTRPADEVVAGLVRSYGMSPSEADKLLRQYGRRG